MFEIRFIYIFKVIEIISVNFKKVEVVHLTNLQINLKL